eukprot:TRINITY_DN12749_c0_g1_i1.p1 TRINITY_DN12749_c0_g1~~TRINITY_DN12749_c0_g1_i1.p1  ORF type:complete len:202 (-),score=49.53 TRINITY_DN12749_c0_g1_i1:342-947(-)
MTVQTEPVPAGVFEDDASWEPRQYAPNTPFALARRIQNNGSGRWPEGCEIAQADGNLGLDPIQLDSIGPGEITTFHLHAHAPLAPGVYNAAFRFRSPLHGYCSEEIWLVFEVLQGAAFAPPALAPQQQMQTEQQMMEQLQEQQLMEDLQEQQQMHEQQMQAQQMQGGWGAPVVPPTGDAGWGVPTADEGMEYDGEGGEMDL